MEPCLGSDVYVHTFCVCIYMTRAWCNKNNICIIITIVFWKMQFQCRLVQIVGDMETTGGDDSDNTSEKCQSGGDGQYNTTGSDASTAVMDKTSPPHNMLDQR